MDLNLAEFLASLAAGGGTFLAARWILERLPKLSRRQRFFAVYGLSFGLATGAYGLQVALGYAAFEWNGLFAACVTAFAASQALWGIFLAGSGSPRPGPLPEPEAIPGRARLLKDLLPAGIANTLAGLGYFTTADIKGAVEDDLARALDERGLNGRLVVDKILEIANL